jgi:hypothetical protein
VNFAFVPWCLIPLWNDFRVTARARGQTAAGCPSRTGYGISGIKSDKVINSEELMVSQSHRLVFAILVGCVIGSLFPTANHISARSPIAMPWLGELLLIISLPGMVFAIAIAGNVHDFSMWAAALGNTAFYSVLVYFILTKRARRRLNRREAARNS